jgi:hypothetical protein
LYRKTLAKCQSPTLKVLLNVKRTRETQRKIKNEEEYAEEEEEEEGEDEEKDDGDKGGYICLL